MASTPCPQKTVQNFFLSELRHISTNCDNFWHKNGKEDKLVTCTHCPIIFNNGNSQIGAKCSVLDVTTLGSVGISSRNFSRWCNAR